MIGNQLRGFEITLDAFILNELDVADVRETLAADRVARGIDADLDVEAGQIAWVAYAASEQGVTRTQVYVQPFAPTGARYQLFAKAGDFPHHPLWTPDGKELLYVPRVGGLEAVTVETEPTLVFGNAVRVPRTFPTAAHSTPGRLTLPRTGRSSELLFPRRLRRQARGSDPSRSS